MFYIFVLFTGICVNGFTQDQEDEAQNLLIIVDSSRSMLQLTRDGKEKLWAAKEAVSKLIEKLPDDVNVALMVFGHRGKNRCDDIELILSLTPLDRTTIMKKLEPLKPTGVTPLSASLDNAAKHLEKFQGESTILLLTDGQETCGGKPVELVSNISKKYGLILLVDVIGLNVKLIERQQLEAIAEASGGNYYSADTSYELVSAVNEIAEQRIIEIREKKGLYGQTEKKSVKDEFGTLIINHNQILSSIAIYDKTGKRVDGKVMWIHSQNHYSTLLEPGRYQIEIFGPSQESPIKVENIRIRANKKTTINVN